MEVFSKRGQIGSSRREIVTHWGPRTHHAGSILARLKHVSRLLRQKMFVYTFRGRCVVGVISKKVQETFR